MGRRFERGKERKEEGGLGLVKFMVFGWKEEKIEGKDGNDACDGGRWGVRGGKIVRVVGSSKRGERRLRLGL